MPIKFPCENCGQVLSVGSRKVGRRAKCPKCFAPLLVPAAEQAAELMAERRQQRQRASDDEELDPFAQFAVYDDEMEVVYETEDEGPEPAGPVDRDLVAVPRLALYTQGVMLGVVALVCFALGVIVGGGFAANTGVAGPTPCVIEGTVQYIGSTNREIPDSGAVVLVLPKDELPDERPEAEGMRPQDAPPLDEDPGPRMVRSIHGAYARTDAEGRFRVRVPDIGEYFVLVVSHGADRPSRESLDRDDLAQLGNYFLQAEELLGDKQYEWKLHRIRADEQMRFVFR